MSTHLNASGQFQVRSWSEADPEFAKDLMDRLRAVGYRELFEGDISNEPRSITQLADDQPLTLSSLDEDRSNDDENVHIDRTTTCAGWCAEHGRGVLTSSVFYE